MRFRKGQCVPGSRGLYEIRGFVREGGTACVYLGCNLDDGSSVAIKVPAESEKSDIPLRRSDRLIREGAILRKVRHKAIVRLIEQIDLSGNPCLVEEYVLGGRMLETFLGKPALVPEALRVISQLADGVGLLHSNNIINRDIHPKNTIMEPERGPVIVDFNTSLYVGERCNRAGTQFFSAPEHLDSQYDPPAAFFASDVYSLGAVLLFLLTGTEPDQYCRNEQDLDSVRSQLRRAETPARIREAIVTSLSPDPVKRPTLQRLKDIATGESSEMVAVAEIKIDGKAVVIRSLTEIGRQHRCSQCEGKEMIYVEDPFPYLEKHHIRLVPEKGRNLSMKVLPTRNSVAVSHDGGTAFERVDATTHVSLGRGDVVALAHNQKKGPYKTFVVS